MNPDVAQAKKYLQSIVWPSGLGARYEILSNQINLIFSKMQWNVLAMTNGAEAVVKAEDLVNKICNDLTLMGWKVNVKSE